MLDPIDALAFEMHSAKGVFALLLGSGVSRAAKIPTGWEITMALVSQLATLRGVTDAPDLQGWYTDTFGKAPDYSDLLNALATTPAQRQHVIAPYIEPSPAERERGDKQPTAAHRAVAALMARGVVKVVLTTNFDRLLELALADLSVHPTVISSADQVAGAIPLVHAGPTIIKLHGDYLDTRILNTRSELSGYDPHLEQMLNRVFDEFGLVICGWSADWDVALKNAIDRAPSRRYSTYWAARGALSSAAEGLVMRRGARLISILDADSFFDELNAKVQALEQVSRPHPLSADLAVAMLKEYLLEPRHAIRLHDLISGEAVRLRKVFDGSQFGVNVWSDEVFAVQAAAYAGATDTLMRMAYVAGRWATLEQATAWVDIVSEFSVRARHVGGMDALLDLMAFPATLVMYAFGLGAVVGGRPANLGAMAARVVDYDRLGRMTLTDRLNVATLVRSGGEARFKSVPRYSDKRVPGAEFLADLLRPIARQDLRTNEAFENAFARLELSLTLGFIERQWQQGKQAWAPTGRFVSDGSLTKSILRTWRSDYQAREQASEPSALACLAAPPRFDDLESLASRVSWGF